MFNNQSIRIALSQSTVEQKLMKSYSSHIASLHASFVGNGINED
jgi:hypothetical protein